MKIVATIATILCSTVVLAQEWPPPVPRGGDSRIVISSLQEDGVVVTVPYNYGMEYADEQVHVEAQADWACGLYQRKAVWYAFNVSDNSCDEMGRAAAERSGNCWHNHYFACAIPPN